MNLDFFPREAWTSEQNRLYPQGKGQSIGSWEGNLWRLFWLARVYGETGRTRG